MHQELPTINGDLLRLRREECGWALSDLATRACMSIKQIRQLEEGGSSAFYSETVKWTSAKKVGSLLGMAPDEVFVQAAPEVTPPSAVEVANDPVSAQASEAMPEQEAIPSPVLQVEPVAVEAGTSAQINETPVSTDSTEASKTPVLALAALFVAALAVAAWMRPEPEVVSEPAPPVLQNMATEANDAASSASAATATPTATANVAANVAASPASQAQKPASTAQAATAAVAPVTATASVTASAAASGSTAASAPRVATPAASAAPVAGVKPANAVQAPASAVAAASKPL